MTRSRSSPRFWARTRALIYMWLVINTVSIVMLAVGLWTVSGAVGKR